MNRYYVQVDFLHHPTLSAIVSANDEANAIAKAVAKSGRGGQMYRNDGTWAQLTTERNAEIRAHHKEEADSGNI
jgi:hypothetical protein